MRYVDFPRDHRDAYHGTSGHGGREVCGYDQEGVETEVDRYSFLNAPMSTFDVLCL